MTHHLCHVEIPVSDLNIAKKFYDEALELSVRIMDNMQYAMADTEWDVSVGFRLEVAPNTEEAVLPFVSAYDLDEALEKVKAAGGTIVLPPTDTPGGTKAKFTDPFGNVIGIWQSER